MREMELSKDNYHLNACHEFINGYLVLSCKVVQMSYQACHDLPHTRRCFRARGINYALREFWIEAGYLWRSDALACRHATCLVLFLFPDFVLCGH